MNMFSQGLRKKKTEAYVFKEHTFSCQLFVISTHNLGLGCVNVNKPRMKTRESSELNNFDEQSASLGTLENVLLV